MIIKAKVNEITGKGVIITTKDGQNQTIEGDSVVLALPYKPNTELYESLKGKVAEIYIVGDSKDPRLILDAVYEGWSAANTI